MSKSKKLLFNIKKGNSLPLGVSLCGKSVNFSVVLPNEKEIRLNIYKKNNHELYETILLTKEFKSGNIFSVMIDDFDFTQFQYMYEAKGMEFIDPYAKVVSGREIWGKCLSVEEQKLIRGEFLFDEFDWGDDKAPNIEYSDMILYRLHVRGFTKHNFSGVKHKGTYLGLIEKIPYLKELGINAIELLPIYEFNEIIMEYNGMDASYLNKYKTNYSQISYKSNPDNINNKDSLVPENNKLQNRYKINYWGYTEEANYFVPKSSYAYHTSNPSSELKTMIHSLHENGIEVILDMFFAQKTNQYLILECLRYWVLEYHIDGFKLNNDVVPINFIATDPILSHVKIFTTSLNIDEIFKADFVPEYKNLAEYNDGFMIDVRRYLKSDEEQVSKFLYRNKRNPLKHAVINYITNTNGFTLMDLVSYDIKHNEANGENNADGTEYNYSWNCGFEGKTRRKKILNLRKSQIKNAFVFLILSQGTPLILSGDEFGNSQNGNNNAYCQDNQSSWLNWNLIKTNQEIFEFVKNLIQIRKEHPILHKKDELRVMDYIACGTPDISYHGTKAWYPDFTNYSRVLGIMLCGKYGKIDHKTDDNYFYFAYNMHWEEHEFDLPDLPQGMSWRVLIDTSMDANEVNHEPIESNINHKTHNSKDNDYSNDKTNKRKELMSEKKNQLQIMKKKYLVKARSIVVFIQDN